MIPNKEICKNCMAKMIGGVDIDGVYVKMNLVDINIKVFEEDEEIFVTADTELRGIISKKSYGRTCGWEECPYILEHMVMEQENAE